MEPVKSFLVVREPPARPPSQTVQLGQGEARWRGWAHSAFPVILLLTVPAGFAGLVYRARHSRHNLAFVITTAYYLRGLIALLYWCLMKLELMPSLDDPAGADERPRVKLVVWIYSVALGNTLALLVSDAMPNLALKLTVWGLTAVGMAIASYFTFRRTNGESCNADLRHGQLDAGRQPHELTPEHRV